MSKQRDAAPDTSTTDTTAQPDQAVQQPQPQPISGSFDSAPVGDNTLKDPVIINR